MRRTATFTLALLVTLGGLAACGDDDDDPEASAGDAPSEETDGAGPAEDATSSDATAPADSAAPAASGKTKPTVEVPAEAPAELVVTDIEAGTGAVAENGKRLSMHYVGVAFSDKKQFDASWDAQGGPKPFPFTLGAREVIPGWDQGLVGMKVGGRRMLVIPPALGYGAAGFPPVIKGDETLVFVVDLLGVS